MLLLFFDILTAMTSFTGLRGRPARVWCQYAALTHDCYLGFGIRGMAAPELSTVLTVLTVLLLLLLCSFGAAGRANSHLL